MNQNITITNIHPRGFAFAISDEGDQVFIPPHIANASPLKIGDKLMSQLVINPNEEQRKNTKFLAVVLSSEVKVDVKDTSVGTAALDEKVFNVICEGQYMTTAELAEQLDLDARTTGNSAMRLFNAGKISKAEVYGRVGQSRASFLMWAKQPSDFVVED